MTVFQYNYFAYLEINAFRSALIYLFPVLILDDVCRRQVCIEIKMKKKPTRQENRNIKIQMPKAIERKQHSCKDQCWVMQQLIIIIEYICWGIT